MELKPPANLSPETPQNPPEGALPPESSSRVEIPLKEIQANANNPLPKEPVTPSGDLPPTPASEIGKFNEGQPPATPPTPPKTPPDYRKKFAESTRENQITNAKLEEATRKLGEFTKEEIPTDEDMKVLDPEWEYRSQFEKDMAKRQIVLDRKLNAFKETVSSITGTTKAVREITEFAYSTDKLAGREEEFIDFANKPDRVGISKDVLLNAFLFEVKDDEPNAPTPTPTPVLERGSGGGQTPPSIGTPKMDADQLQQLRKSDPKTYNEMVRTGQI